MIVPLRVSQLTQRIKDLLESIPDLQDVWVEGEVSNFGRSASGHCFFTLKDEFSQIACVLFRTEAEAEAARLARPVDRVLEDGEQLEVRGQVRVYERAGRYQLYVVELRPVGEGELYRRFLALKEKLQGEGLFDRPRRPLPSFPRRIGLVTSARAAALQDIHNVLTRRYPLAELYLAASPVQGIEAPLQLVAALQRLYEHQPPMEVILLARGGGSLEELMAFNDERVARMVAASPVPVVTGVGHETDFTIVDFVSDERAPTPSAAAELITPDRQELLAGVEESRRRLAAIMARRLHERGHGLRRVVEGLGRRSPRNRLLQLRREVDALRGRALAAARYGLRLRRERLAGLSGKVHSLSPLAVLERGYSITYHLPSGQILRDPDRARAGDALRIRLARGELDAQARPWRAAPGARGADGQAPRGRPEEARQMTLLPEEER